MGAAMVTTLLYARRKRCYMRLPPPLVAGRLDMDGRERASERAAARTREGNDLKGGKPLHPEIQFFAQVPRSPLRVGILCP